MKLKWSLAELQKNQNGIYPVSGQADLSDSLKSRNRELLNVSLIDIAGSISIEGKRRYYVDLTLDVDLTMPSSRSLEPVVLDLTIPFNEIYLAPSVRVTDFEDLDEDDVFSLEMDILDLHKPIEDTILAAIPLKILSKEEEESNDLPTGHDWAFMLEDDVASPSTDEEITSSKPSPFDVLKDLQLFEDAEEDEE